jgi:hypothetical protein
MVGAQGAELTKTVVALANFCVRAQATLRLMLPRLARSKDRDEGLA